MKIKWENINRISFIFCCLIFIFCCSLVEKKPKTEPKGAVEEIQKNTQGLTDAKENNKNEVTKEAENQEAVTEFEIEKDHAQIIKNALDEYQLALGYWEKADVDNALKYLDSTYGLILQLDDIKDQELIQEKDELRLLIAKRINEIYTAHLLAVGENNKTIPLIENEYIKKEINSFQTRERKYFISSYKRSGKYRDMILKIFKEKGIPEELAWIPIVESGFKLRAYSRARALGLWQFISSTGYRFGLKRTRWIDERMDPQKATRAAAEYLKELHSFFGDWPTVLAAYNCGEFRVQRLIRAQRVNYLDNFWDLFAMLPRETRRFVPRITAVILIVTNPRKYGFYNLPTPDSPIDYEIISVSKPVKLSILAKELSLPENSIEELNPELKYKTTPTDVYYLKVPKGLGELSLEKIQNMKKWIPPRSRYAIHYVRRGETVSLIAKKYRMSVNSILRLNGLRSRSIIRPRQRLKIPISGSSGRYVKSKSISSNTYKVRRGDSLSKIAYMSGMSVAKIKALNNLQSNSLSVGQVLKFKPGKPKNADVYIVKSGDTPYSIAKKFNMFLAELLRINGFHKYSKIYPGQKIWIKK